MDDAVKLTLAKGETLLEGLLRESVELEHECGGTLACATCRVVVREGLERLEAAAEDELDTAERLEALDTVFESRGVRIAVDARSLPRVHGSVLDIVQEGLARRLRFANPNARSTCGCGESFGA